MSVNGTTSATPAFESRFSLRTGLGVRCSDTKDTFKSSGDLSPHPAFQLMFCPGGRNTGNSAQVANCLGASFPALKQIELLRPRLPRPPIVQNAASTYSGRDRLFVPHQRSEIYFAVALLLHTRYEPVQPLKRAQLLPVTDARAVQSRAQQRDRLIVDFERHRKGMTVLSA